MEETGIKPMSQSRIEYLTLTAEKLRDIQQICQERELETYFSHEADTNGSIHQWEKRRVCRKFGENAGVKKVKYR